MADDSEKKEPDNSEDRSCEEYTCIPRELLMLKKDSENNCKNRLGTGAEYLTQGCGKYQAQTSRSKKPSKPPDPPAPPAPPPPPAPPAPPAEPEPEEIKETPKAEKKKK